MTIGLTRPQFNLPGSARKQKGWILITPENMPAAYEHFPVLIDSLLGAGLEFHFFNPGFREGNFKESLQPQTSAAADSITNFWDYAAALNDSLPPDVPVYIFSDNYLSHFAGKRPSVSNNIKWFSFLPQDTATVQFHPSTVDRAAVSITIYSEKNSKDDYFLRAGLQAIQQFNKMPVKISIMSDPSLIPANQDWLFWLSTDKVPESQHSKNIFNYEAGVIRKRNSWLLRREQPSFSTVELYQAVDSSFFPSTGGTIIWEDGFGSPILFADTGTDIHRYHFYSRFDPKWNDLVWSAAFPEWIQDLIQNQPEVAKPPVKDKRIIDPEQLQPRTLQEVSFPASTVPARRLDLTTYCWWLLCCLFFAERIIAINYYKRNADD